MLAPLALAHALKTAHCKVSWLRHSRYANACVSEQREACSIEALTCCTQTAFNVQAPCQPLSTMRFASTAKVLLKCKLKYYRISECSVLCGVPGQPGESSASHRLSLVARHFLHPGAHTSLHSPGLQPGPGNHQQPGVRHHCSLGGVSVAGLHPLAHGVALPHLALAAWNCMKALLFQGLPCTVDPGSSLIPRS